MRWMGIAIMCAVLTVQATPSRAAVTAAVPPNDYNILIFYELGMHCSGFDLSYCCVLPPYNSVLAQIVKTSKKADEKPKLLSAEDLKGDARVLWYEHEENTFSEGPKML